MRAKTKPKHIVKKTHPLNVLVNLELYEVANKARTRTWVEIIEDALRREIKP